MTAVAIIPARGGSKRVPRKNVKSFGGKPMLSYSIEAALRAGCFDRVVVSTDCEHIAEVARNCGAEVPFIRPAALAHDYAPVIVAISHALRELACSADDVACCIQATAPFLSSEDLLRGRDYLLREDADFAISVTSFAFPIQRAVRITEGNRLSMLSPEHYLTRSQDLDEAWHDAAQFYWGRAEAFLKERPIFGDGTVPVRIARHLVQDIDTPEDWTRAEAMQRALLDLGMLDVSRLPR